MEHNKTYLFFQKLAILAFSLATSISASEWAFGILKGVAQVLVSLTSLVVGFFALRYLNKRFPKDEK